MGDDTVTTTPELDKQIEAIQSGRAQVVQDFYDWLTHETEFVFARWTKIEGYRDERLVPAEIQPEQLMADFFGIDRDKIDAERRALLESIQHDGGK